MTAGAIPAKPVFYQQHRFRSTLEARWAYAFDHLGVRWEYEQEPPGPRRRWSYRPDFWLPDGLSGDHEGLWFEVKPDNYIGHASAHFVWPNDAQRRSLLVTRGMPWTSAAQRRGENLMTLFDIDGWLDGFVFTIEEDVLVIDLVSPGFMPPRRLMQAYSAAWNYRFEQAS